MQLHLGCGKRNLSGFYHIDLAGHPHIDYKDDIRDLYWLQDLSVDLIYASHVIEYFEKDKVVGILKEWHRVLKKGGILRLAVPDFKALVEIYLNSFDVNLIRGPLYGEWKIPGTNQVIYHKTVYDFSSLQKVFEDAGFINIRHWDWREVFKDHKGFDDYSQSYIPHMDKENGILISLNMEATK